MLQHALLLNLDTGQTSPSPIFHHGYPEPESLSVKIHNQLCSDQLIECVPAHEVGIAAHFLADLEMESALNKM
jgi:hypothetical protein